MTAALYVRVSTLNQIERESLSTQESRLKAYCKANNIASYKIYKDAGISAKDIKRPALEQLMQDTEQEKIQTIIVTKLDRITRSLKDLIGLMEFFEKHKVKFISISQNIDTTGPMGRFMLNLLGSVAQVEREMTAERVAEDMHHRALTGKWNGGPIPYGYTIRRRIINELKEKGSDESEAIKEASKKTPEAKRLYIDEEEAEIMKKIYEMYLEEKSLRGVTDRLNAEGYKTRKSLPWATASVSRVLTNPTYTGRILYGKKKTSLTGQLEKVPKENWKIVKGEHERIISDDIFYKVQELVQERSFKRTKATKTYLLSGLLKCGKCKGPVYGYTYRKKHKDKKGKTKITEYFWYRCHNYGSKGSKICKGLVVPGKKLDERVIRELTKISEDREVLKDKKKLMGLVREKIEKPDLSYKKEIGKLERGEKKLERRKEVLLEKFESEIIDDLTFKEEFERIKRLLEKSRRTQAEMKTTAGNKEICLASLENSLDELENFEKNWEFLDEEGKKARIMAIVKEIEVNENELIIRLFIDSPDVYPLLTDKKPLPGGFKFVAQVSHRDRDSLLRQA